MYKVVICNVSYSGYDNFFLQSTCTIVTTFDKTIQCNIVCRYFLLVKINCYYERNLLYKHKLKIWYFLINSYLLFKAFQEFFAIKYIVFSKTPYRPMLRKILWQNRMSYEQKRDTLFWYGDYLQFCRTGVCLCSKFYIMTGWWIAEGCAL